MSQHHHVDGHLPAHPETATLEGRNKVTGFWLLLAAETVIFGSLFATFIGLRDQVAGGPSGQELFELPMVALMTFILLTSSMTSVLAVQAMHRHDVKNLALWLTVTVILGFAFLGLEIYEFYHYLHEKDFSMQTSAFSSAFYTLVSFHGAHVLFGVIWIALLVGQLKKKSLTVVTAPKVYVASLYWHFIDVVWVFIFSVVYLMGKVG